MNVVLIDSGGANIGSVRHAFERLGVEGVRLRVAERSPPLVRDPHVRILSGSPGWLAAN